MKPLNILVFLLIFNTFILLGFLVSEFTGKVTYDKVLVNVTRIIDGDTVVVSGDIGKDIHIRLLGINTPEKKQPFHDEAMNYLKSIVEGKQVELEDHGQDKYQRTLGYIFYNNQLINKKQLEAGYANLYYYGTDQYYPEMKQAEQNARESEAGIWNKSPSHGCLKLISLKYNEGAKRCTNNEQLVIQNSCNSIQAIIKDDANHISDVNINPGAYTQNFSCVWNDEGDTLTVRDEQGLLLWYRY